MIKGKKILCSTEKYQENFKTFADFIKDENWLKKLEGIVNSNIDIAFRDFLAEPVVSGDDLIEWFAKYDKNDIKPLNTIEDEEKERYKEIKNKTLKHYNDTIASLENQGKLSEAKILKDAIRFSSDDQFLFCTGEKVILGVWGMQLRDEVRGTIGKAIITHFSPAGPHKPPSESILETPPSPLSEKEADENDDFKQLFTIKFNNGVYGKISGETAIKKVEGDRLSSNEVPEVQAIEGYEFTGWNEEPRNHKVTGNKVFKANYKQQPVSLPWYTRFWNWLSSLLFGRGCLKWLFWLLIILLAIWLLGYLCKGCETSYDVRPIPSPIEEKPFVKDNLDSLRGGIYYPGEPYNPIETPKEYHDILPPQEGVLPPLDSNRLVREPGRPVIVDNRLNILMENEEKSILQLASDFKSKYPDDNYKVVYYDDVVKRMQIEVPPSERERLKTELPEAFAPEYLLFVFDESLFTANYIPNDPAVKDSKKSKYLRTVNALEAWDITKGSDKITIAIVDNGFNLEHPELKSKVVMPYNIWTHSPAIHSQALDHGTHVAGTALAIMDNGVGLCGIAAKSSFMPVQVANNQGIMTTTSLLDGILYSLYQGADVINVSLGLDLFGSIPEELQHDLMNNHFKEEERLWLKVMNIANKHNATIVMAAGNNDILAAVDPTNRPQNFVVVSAVDEQGNTLKKARFSNYGNYSTISAPGVDIYSSIGKDKFATMSGTSMAAPIVSGTIALMKSLNTSLTTEEIICILQSTGKETNASIGKMIQIDKALKKVKEGESTECGSDFIEEELTPTSGDVQVLLSWDNYNDLDLICVDPYGNTIWFNNKRVPSGGQLEIDMNANPGHSRKPIENIFWPNGGAPNGTYDVYLLYYARHESSSSKTPYKVTAKYDGKTDVYEGEVGSPGERIHICSIALDVRNLTGDSNNGSKDKAESLRKEKEELQMRLKRIERELERVDDQNGKK